MSNIISLSEKLPLEQRVQRDMRMYKYDPDDPDEEDEPLVVEMKLGSRTFSVSIILVKNPSSKGKNDEN